MESLAVEVSSTSKTYGETRALDNVTLEVRPGEMVALIGASGSGKSTLLRHISGLVPADRESGAIRVFGERIQAQGRVNWRIRRLRRHVGFIFQQFNLVGRLDLLTNVLVGALPRVPIYRSLPRLFTRAEKLAAMEALHRVGMARFAGQRASTLSGGQQQRGAIARALMQQAAVVLADEPIASLDPESSRRVMAMLKKINEEDGVTVLVSLHQVDFAFRYCRRAVALKDGRTVFDGPCAKVSTEMLHEIYGSKFGESGLEGEGETERRGEAIRETGTRELAPLPAAAAEV